MAQSVLKRSPCVQVWFVVLMGVLFYGPMSPVQHAYLEIPLRVVLAVLCALLSARILESPSALPPFRLLAIFLVLGMGAAIKPRFCNPGASLEALRNPSYGKSSTSWPVGYVPFDKTPAAAFYPWADYRATLDYLRNETNPSTRVANALKLVPALTGPSGRLSAFPAESLAWLWMVRGQDEALFADALAKVDDAVVVWIPDERTSVMDARFPLIEAVIRRRFRHDRSFGAIQIWLPKIPPKETSKS